MTDQTWNADLYDSRHAFVSALGDDLLDLLDAQPGERVLDLGCGTGDHVAALLRRGIAAVGIDASPDMIAKAMAKHPGLPVTVGDARTIDYGGTLDAVLSNAVLHWVPQAHEAAEAIHRSLRPGGRFVAEFGGAGNTATVLAGVATARAAAGASPISPQWYFPTIAQYAAVLERAGFAVGAAWLFDRPTRLDGPHGLSAWLRMFGGYLSVDVPDPEALLAAVEDELRPTLWRDDSWWVDYRRIRVVATKF